MENPFRYSKPVPPDELIDREAEAEQLLALLRGGHNCRLSAPRRYGKTSLVHKVRADAEKDGTATVYVNFYGILSLEDAVARLERGYRELQGPLKRWMAGKLSSMQLTLATPVGGVSVGSLGQRDPSRMLQELLELPRQLFGKSGERVLVCFDEFQEVMAPRAELDGVIRSVIEQHTEEASYLFAGSQPAMMEALFEDRERPFYGQARGVPLGPLAGEDLAAYVGSWFEKSRRDVGESLRPLLDVSQGHPQRAMMLAHFLWECTPVDTEADEGTFWRAYQMVSDELAEAFDRTWQGLDDGERRTLVAVAVSNGAPTRADALQAADVPRSTLKEALVRLRGAGHLAHAGGVWRFVDPLFGRWVAQGRLED
jgi:hypothetical protein